VTDATEGESTWARLTRRKVVQWGIAYAAGAWGLLQGLAYVTDTFHWQEYIQQSAALALLIGLPVVLVLAWYHGDRGEQRLSATELTILTLLFLVGGGIFWLYQRGGATPTIATPTAGAPIPAVATDSRPSIAVLPFENRSDEHKDAFFVDGIHDDILTQLSKVSALKVISRTSVEQFRDTKLPTKTIAEQLGVTKILEGGVQRAGDRVRVTVQLIDAATDAHLWAESYDRDLSAANIFAIQSEVAAAIAGTLKATLTPAERRSVNAVPTQNLEAWEAYQLGRQRMAKRTSTALVDAEKFFQRAIELDPRFALAYAGLADTLMLIPQYSDMPSDASLARAEKAAGTASELDPNLAEAWTSLAAIAAARGQYDRAEPLYRRAIALNPNYSTANQWFGEMLNQLGRRDEAVGFVEAALASDPLSAVINQTLGIQLSEVGRFDEAEARLRRAIEIDPSMPTSYTYAGLLQAYVLNRFAEAVPILGHAAELDPGGPLYAFWLFAVYLDLGADAEATRLVESARERWPDETRVLAMSAVMHLYRREQTAALRDAQGLLALEPRASSALRVLRNADLQAGRPGAARARYARAYPELFVNGAPKIDGSNWRIALDLAPVLQKTGENDRAGSLLNRSEQFVRTIPRLGIYLSSGYGIADAQIHALRGQHREALSALRAAEKAGWRGPYWRYYRDFDPALASIRSDPEFNAAFADIERDMARQRAELAARPKDAPLDLGSVH